MTPLSWEYVAGFFDGEGCIRIADNKKVPQFSLRATFAQSADRGHKVLNEIRIFLEDKGIKSKIYTVGKQHELTICRREICNLFLAKILPFLRIKKNEAEDILRFSKLFPKIQNGKRRYVL